MAVVLIFAGGAGVRMSGSEKPKQFLEAGGKPIIIHTLELFEKNDGVEAIVVVCIEGWEDFLRGLLKEFGVEKVCAIVKGGKTGQDSIYNGLCEISRRFDPTTTVLIHDGVRPLINQATITHNIECVKEHRSAITCVQTTETFMVMQNEGVTIPEREVSLMARAPQGYVLGDIMDAHNKALQEGRHDFIDSCTLMHYYGYPLQTMLGPVENIKITTPLDFEIFKAIVNKR